MSWKLFGCLVLLITVGCGSGQKPSEEQIHAARSSNVLTRDIDKSHEVADEASKRVDDPALH